MSPGTLPPAPGAEDAFNDQTLRQTIRLSAGGDQLRLRLSNVHGNKPLHVGAVSIARHDRSSAVDATTLKNTDLLRTKQHNRATWCRCYQ